MNWFIKKIIINKLKIIIIISSHLFINYIIRMAIVVYCLMTNSLYLFVKQI